MQATSMDVLGKNNIKKVLIDQVSIRAQAVDKCRNCMSQQPVLMRKSAKNVII